MAISSKPLPLDEEYARQVGSILRELRESSGDPIESIGNAMLLTASQIEGLERYELKCFYGTRIFAKMLQKYAKRLNYSLDMDRLTLSRGLLVGEYDVMPNVNGSQDMLGRAISRVFCERTPRFSGKRIRLKDAWGYAFPWHPLRWAKSRLRKSSAMRFMLYVSVALIGVSSSMQWDELKCLLSQCVSVSRSIDAPTETTMNEMEAGKAHDGVGKSEISAAAIDKPIGLGKIVLETTAACWIQLNFADGKTRQSVYPAGTRLEFSYGELSGMIIGNVPAARLMVNRNVISLAGYQKPDTNVARLLGSDAVHVFGK